jgi:hypothetical protein
MMRLLLRNLIRGSIMKSNNLIRFLAAVAGIFLLRATDLILTFLYTPDLKGEWNPLVARFDAAWTGMMLAQAGIIAVIAVPMYFYFVASTMPITEPGLRYNEWVYYYFFRTRPRGLKRIFVRPRNGKGGQA